MSQVLSMLSWVVRDASAARDAARSAAAAASRASRSAAARSAAAAASRASRSAAARSAAAAASRAARSAAAAASRASRGASCIRSLMFPKSRRRPRRRSLPHDPVPGTVVTDKDVESDEAIWALYELWCKAFNKKRDNDEMARRFNRFKETVVFVHKNNKSYIDEPEEQLYLGEFTDGLDAQEIDQLKNEPGRSKAFLEVIEMMRID